MLQEWNEITKTIQSNIVVLAMPLLNTKEQEDTMKMFIVDTEAFEEAYQEWKAGEIKAVDAMPRLELPGSAFYRLVKRYEKLY